MPALLIFVIIVIIVLVAGAFYYLGSNKLTLRVEPAVTPTAAPTTVTAPTAPTLPTGIPSTISGTLNSSANSPAPTLAPRTGSTIYSSSSLGIRFYHALLADAKDAKSSVKTMETGNKIYVYIESMVPTTGQYVEKLAKSPGDTLEQAIKKQFLSGIPESECFVTTSSDPRFPTGITKATIAYPVPTDAQEPAFTFGDACPDPYTAKGGMAFFTYDPSKPGTFLFFKIGQYAIPSQNSGDQTWEQTVQTF